VIKMEDIVLGLRRRHWLTILPALGLLLLAPAARAQQPGYRVFMDPERRYSVEYPPDWTWL
jgi:hypothetical protein